MWIIACTGTELSILHPLCALQTLLPAVGFKELPLNFHPPSAESVWGWRSAQVAQLSTDKCCFCCMLQLLIWGPRMQPMALQSNQSCRAFQHCSVLQINSGKGQKSNMHSSVAWKKSSSTNFWWRCLLSRHLQSFVGSKRLSSCSKSQLNKYTQMQIPRLPRFSLVTFYSAVYLHCRPAYFSPAAGAQQHKRLWSTDEECSSDLTNTSQKCLKSYFKICIVFLFNVQSSASSTRHKETLLTNF